MEKQYQITLTESQKDSLIAILQAIRSISFDIDSIDFIVDQNNWSVGIDQSKRIKTLEDRIEKYMRINHEKSERNTILEEFLSNVQNSLNALSEKGGAV